MASVLTGQIDINVAARRKITGGLSTPTEDLAYAIALTLENGTGVNQAQYFYNATLAFSISTPQTLDVFGSLVDGLGVTMNFATVRAIIIKNKSETAGQILTVGGAASNQFAGMFSDVSDKLVIRPGGTAILLAPRDGYTVTTGTADQLKFDPGAAAFSADVIIIGT